MTAPTPEWSAAALEKLAAMRTHLMPTDCDVCMAHLAECETIAERAYAAGLAAAQAAPPASEPTDGIRGECWYCMKPGHVYRHSGGYNLAMCDVCRDSSTPPASPGAEVVERVAEVLQAYIAADEKVLGYAAVMLGVDADGNGPGESKTGAVAAVSQRIARARSALAAAQAAQPASPGAEVATWEAASRLAELWHLDDFARQLRIEAGNAALQPPRRTG